MLKGNVAVVTGGSRGIGRAIALRLAKEGADVAVLYAGNEAAAAETVAEIETLGQRAKAYRCDVADYDGTKQTVEEILSDFRAVDILVNNAGITRDGLILQLDEAKFSAVLDTNLKGAFYMIKHLYAPMMRRRKGRIINISSVVGLTGNAGQANYASAKAGLIGLTKSVAKELAGRNITCNAVAPGFIATDMTDAMPEKAKQAVLSSIPMKRTGLPEDIAAAVAFLAGEDAGYITGTVLKVDGGLCM